MLVKGNGKLIAASYLLKYLLRIATHSQLQNLAKSTRKLYSTKVFFCWEIDVMPNISFALSSDRKD